MFIRRSFFLFCVLFTPFLSQAEKFGVPSLPKAKTDIEKNWQQKKTADGFGMLDKGVLARVFSTNAPRIRIPGFISIYRVRTYGTIIGDTSHGKKAYRESASVYISWEESRPNKGDIFAVYTPRFILQSKTDFINFEVISQKSPALLGKLKTFNHAGFFYEINAEIEIVDTSRGIIRANVKNLYNQVHLGDKLIKPLPVHTRIPRRSSSNKVTASVVMGHPYDRISPIEGSFLYINRGAKDGVDIGTVFNTLEPINLYKRNPIKKKIELGEAVAVFTTANYSTAFITKQWDSIRLGSLLQTKGHVDEAETELEAEMKQKVKRRSPLDIIEKELDIEGLSDEERARLEALHQQEVRKKRNDSSDSDDLITGPEEEGGGVEEEVEEEKNLATKYFDNNKRKKRKKKRRQDGQKLSDEEGLNSLF